MPEPQLHSRVTLKLTPEGREALDDIMARTGANDVSEVVRDAMRVYDAITEDVHVHSNQVLSRDGESGEVSLVNLWPDKE